MKIVESVIYTLGTHGKMISMLLMAGALIMVGFAAASSAENLVTKMQSHTTAALIISR